MIRAVSGAMWNERGIIKAIAMGGFSPGMAPMTSPTITPNNMAEMFCKDIALIR